MLQLSVVAYKYGIYLQHQENMTKDASFKAADRQRFKGWLQRWRQARIPLLACLFISSYNQSWQLVKMKIRMQKRMEGNDYSRRKKTGRFARYMLITGPQFMHTGWQ